MLNTEQTYNGAHGFQVVNYLLVTHRYWLKLRITSFKLTIIFSVSFTSVDLDCYGKMFLSSGSNMSVCVVYTGRDPCIGYHFSAVISPLTPSQFG